jgi:hypothetical protein
MLQVPEHILFHGSPPKEKTFPTVRLPPGRAASCRRIPENAGSKAFWIRDKHGH